jgi:hypothetical protein
MWRVTRCSGVWDRDRSVGLADAMLLEHVLAYVLVTIYHLPMEQQRESASLGNCASRSHADLRIRNVYLRAQALSSLHGETGGLPLCLRSKGARFGLRGAL